MGKKCETCLWYLSKAIQHTVTAMTSAYERRTAEEKRGFEDLKAQLRLAKRDVEVLEEQNCIDPEDAAIIKEDIDKAVKSNDLEKIEDAAYYARERLLWNVSKTVADACQRE